MSWPMVKLGDICDLQNGYAFKSSDYVDISNTLSCRMSNIRPGGLFDIDYNSRFLPDDFADKYSQFLLNDGDVIIAMTDLADSPKILGVPTVVKTSGKNILLNQRVGKLVIKDANQIHFPYLKLALNYPRVRDVYKKYAGGGLQINLGKSDLLSVEIPLPPLAEQKRIAAILDKADAIRRKRQQAIQLADDFLRAVFLEMFGDPVTNPKGWEVKPLGTIFKLSSGQGLTAKEMDKSGTYPVYGGNGINGYHTEYMFDEPQLIIGRVGVYCGVVHITEKKSWVTDNALYVKEYSTDVNVDYLAQLLTMANLNQYAGKAAQPLVSGSRIYPLEMMFPPIEEQIKFSKVKEFFVEQIKKTTDSEKSKAALFESLSQKAFSGQL